MSCSSFSIGCPVSFTKSSFAFLRRRMISLALMAMSEAVPRTPELGWCSITRLLGRIRRRSLGGAARTIVAALAARPVTIDVTGASIDLMRS